MTAIIGSGGLGGFTGWLTQHLSRSRNMVTKTGGRIRWRNGFCRWTRT